MNSSSGSHASAGASTGPDGGRRRFFQLVIKASAGLIGLSLAVPLFGYLVSPTFKRRAQQWVDVASVGELPAGIPKQLEYVATVQDGYLETKTQKALWAVKQANGDVTAQVNSSSVPVMEASSISRDGSLQDRRRGR